MSGTLAKISPQWIGTTIEGATSSSNANSSNTTNNNSPSSSQQQMANQTSNINSSSSSSSGSTATTNSTTTTTTTSSSPSSTLKTSSTTDSAAIIHRDTKNNIIKNSNSSAVTASNNKRGNTSSSSCTSNNINRSNNNNNYNNNMNKNNNNELSFTIRKDVLSRIGKFLNDSSYKEFIESSSTFNQKLVQERKFRLPFLDSQTGVAQSDCCLWMTKNDRLPQKDLSSLTNSNSTGKIYTYPAKRWVKRKRQYLLDDIYLRTRHQHLSSYTGPSTSAAQDQSMLMDHSSNDTQQLLHHSHLQHHHHHHNSSTSSAHVKMTDTGAGHNSNSNSFYNHNDITNHNHHNDSSFMHDSSSNSNAYPWTINEQSKDATTSSKVDPDDSTSEATAHGDLDDSNDPHQPQQHQQQNHLNHHQQQHQQPQQSLQHQNQNQSLNQSTTQPQQSHHSTPASSTPKKKRERKYKIEKTNDPLKPYKCDRCDMSYKTRPGLTYHRNHCHAQNIVGNSSGDDTINYDDPNNFGNNHTGTPSNNTNHTPSRGSRQTQSSSLTSSNHSSGNAKSNDNKDSNHGTNNKNGETPATITDNNNDINVLCDFCLGDANENKRTQKPEELVSCADCGRAGHPTCMNFTPNMLLSAKKYKWQCLECKSCALCGTSDDDEKLLFCDDCDRGYHMYCLNPPLETPPEGSWSCSPCIKEYHSTEEKEKIQIEAQ